MASGQGAALSAAGNDSASAAAAPSLAKSTVMKEHKVTGAPQPQVSKTVSYNNTATEETHQAGAPCEANSDITTSSRFAGTTKAAERTVLKDKQFTQPDRRSTPQYAEDSEDEEFQSADEGDKYSHLKGLSGYLGLPQHFPLPSYQGDIGHKQAVETVIQHLHMEGKMIEKGILPFGPEMTIPFVREVLEPHLAGLEAEAEMLQTQVTRDEGAVQVLSSYLVKANTDRLELDKTAQQITSSREIRAAEIAILKEEVAALKAKKASLIVQEKANDTHGEAGAT